MAQNLRSVCCYKSDRVQHILDFHLSLIATEFIITKFDQVSQSFCETIFQSEFITILKICMKPHKSQKVQAQ